MDKRYYHQPIEAVLQELEVNQDKGLSAHEVVERQKIYGENTFTPPKEKSMLEEMKEILTQQLIVILLIAAGISLLIKEYHDAIGICLAVFIGSAIGLLTESKSKKAADALARMSEDIYVKVLREGKIEKIHKSELVVGDIVYLESGDSVPADGRILESTDFKVREDMLTGESDDVKKRAGIVKEEKITREGEEVLQEPVPAKQYNMVFGGTLVACGQAVIIITATGDVTQMGNIAKELSEKETDTPLQLKLDNLGKGISKVSTGVASFLFLYMLRQILQGAAIEWNLQGDLLTEQTLQQLLTCFPEIKTAFVVCVALIVAAVPEGLPTMINITLSITMKKMASIHALVRKKEACETIGAVSVICSDKTGTLTQNCMKVEEIYLQGKEIEKQHVRNYSEFFHNCIINSTAIVEQTRGEESYIGSATECALLALCKEKDCRKFRQTQKILRQIPFQSEKKYMLTIIEEEGKYSIYSKGAPEVILMQCGYEERDGVVKVLTSERKKSILEEIARLQEQAMRVLAFAHQKVKVHRNYLKKEEWKEELIFTGFVGIRDPLREGVEEAIHIAKQGGIETKMLTGDNIHTAVAIGKELGMMRKGMRAVEASYIELLTDKELERELPSIAIVARSKPETKMRIVQALQRKGEIVAVTGDGINDAPALAKADVGIAMGIAGTEVSKNAADIILTDDSFNAIVHAIEWGRGIYNNFQRFIQFQLTVNIIAFVIAIISQLAGYGMPFSTIHLLWINMIMDGPPALALGLEPIRASVMERKPIPREVPIINSYMVRTIAINSSIIIGLLYLQIRYNLLGASNNVIGAASQKQTVLFSLFAFSILFNAFNCREFGTGSIFPNLLKNKLAIKIIFITALLQILITQFGGAFFQAVPLPFVMWSKIIGLSSIIIWMNELVKWTLRSMKKSAKKVIRHVRLLN